MVEQRTVPSLHPAAKISVGSMQSTSAAAEAAAAASVNVRYTSHINQRVHVVGVQRQALLVKQRIAPLPLPKITTGLPLEKWRRRRAVAAHRNTGG